MDIVFAMAGTLVAIGFFIGAIYRKNKRAQKNKFIDALRSERISRFTDFLAQQECQKLKYVEEVGYYNLPFPKEQLIIDLYIEGMAYKCHGLDSNLHAEAMLQLLSFTEGIEPQLLTKLMDYDERIDLYYTNRKLSILEMGEDQFVRAVDDVQNYVEELREIKRQYRREYARFVTMNQNLDQLIHALYPMLSEVLRERSAA